MNPHIDTTENAEYVYRITAHLENGERDVVHTQQSSTARALARDMRKKFTRADPIVIERAPIGRWEEIDRYTPDWHISF